MRYGQLNFLIPRDHLHSRGRRVKAFGRAAAPESQSVRQRGDGRTYKTFGRAATAKESKRSAEMPRPESRSVRQSVEALGKAAAAGELKRGHYFAITKVDAWVPA